jgi:hypothetical protein
MLKCDSAWVPWLCPDSSVALTADLADLRVSNYESGGKYDIILLLYTVQSNLICIPITSVTVRVEATLSRKRISQSPS